MNTRTWKNGAIIRERIIKWRGSDGKTKQHRVKEIPSNKRRKLNHPDNFPDVGVPPEIGSKTLGSRSDNLDGSETTPGTRQKQSQLDMFFNWCRRIPEYREALLSNDNIDSIQRCHCNRDWALFNCRTCVSTSSHCASCVAMQHKNTPFHRIAKWNGVYLEDIQASEIGISLQISLCHPDGTLCHMRHKIQKFTVVDVNGFHEIPAEFCACTGSSSTAMDIQLFTFQLFSASMVAPKTAFTFQVLEQFRMLNLEGKTSAYTFTKMLVCLTAGNELGVGSCLDRAREFQRVARQWALLLALKESVLSDSASGLLVAACPACPRPGINISPSWEDETPRERHWIYRQFLHFDANFRLVLENRSKGTAPTTGHAGMLDGRAFFVPDAEYREYIAQADQNVKQQASTCSNHRAIATTGRSRFHSLAVTGIAGAVCRHECAVPGSFVNLYKGERYVNSNYGLSNACSNLPRLKDIIISYDIACQYSKNFVDRFTNCNLLTQPTANLHWLIPKFHLPAHQEGCRHLYSFNYAKGVGRTDGEAIERFWSPHNYLSGSTSKMSYDFRMDTLNLQFSDWNMRKACHMGHELCYRLCKAREQQTTHAAYFADLCGALDPDKVERWTNLEDNSVSIPGECSVYQVATEKEPTRASILTSLTRLENDGRDCMAPNNHSKAALWINEGLELEESQRRIHLQSQKVNNGLMDIHHIALANSRRALWERVIRWNSRSPDGSNEQDEEVDQAVPDGNPEDEELLFPSMTDADRRLPQLAEIEKELRKGQANEALKALRNQLAQRLVIHREMGRFLRGQNSLTRAHSALGRIQAQISESARGYRNARAAMLRLGMPEND